MFRLLLYPFSILYDLVTRIRNYQYDKGLKPSVEFEIPVIVVGNLTVGGTGKTPMIEHLIRLLSPLHKTAILSRGYGRKTKGMIFARANDNADTLGDEPFQFYKKFGNKVSVTVAEDRAFAIPNILQTDTDTEIILMDDGYQHRRVRPSFSILLSDYNRPFYNDYVLPAGNLRESRAEAARADVVVVTKCPSHIEEDEMMQIEKDIRDYVEKPIFFSTIHYGSPISFGNDQAVLQQNVIMLSGIGNALPFKEYIKSNFTLVKEISYRDHHRYSLHDVNALIKQVEWFKDVCIITTEKDMVKLDVREFSDVIRKLPIFYLPIEVDFIKDGEDFDELVLNATHRVA